MYVDEPWDSALYRCKTESVEFTRWMTTLQAQAMKLAGYQLVRIHDAGHPPQFQPRRSARQ